MGAAHQHRPARTVVLRACLVCQRAYQPTRYSKGRCPAHQLPKRSGSYTRTARTVVAAALQHGTPCHLCGQPFTDPADPPVADHLVARSLGGSDAIGNLAAAHRSCNGRRGATQTATELWHRHI